MCEPNPAVGTAEAAMPPITFSEAVKALNLYPHQARFKSAIVYAWKSKVLKAHPDKCESEHATEQTQLLNEARDFLLGWCAKSGGQTSVDVSGVGGDDESIARGCAARESLNREREAKEREIREKGERMREEREREAREKEAREKEAKERATNEMREKIEQDEAEENWKRNRKNRGKKYMGSRCRKHVKTEENREGREMLKEMVLFFRDNYRPTSKPRKRLLMFDMQEFFFKCREKHTEFERNLFRRHCRRIFAKVWPSAEYASYNNRKCFLNVEMRASKKL